MEGEQSVAGRGHRKRKRDHQESSVTRSSVATTTSADTSTKATTRTQKTLKFLACTFRQHAELMLNQSNFMAEFPLFLGFGGGRGVMQMQMQIPQNSKIENVDGSENIKILHQNKHQSVNQNVHESDGYEFSQNNDEEEHLEETNKSDQATSEQEKVFSTEHDASNITPTEQLADKDLYKEIEEIFAEVTDTSKLTLKDFRNLVEKSLSVKLDKEQRKLLKAYLIQLITKSLSSK